MWQHNPSTGQFGHDLKADSRASMRRCSKSPKTRASDESCRVHDQIASGGAGVLGRANNLSTCRDEKHEQKAVIERTNEKHRRQSRHTSAVIVCDISGLHGVVRGFLDASQPIESCEFNSFNKKSRLEVKHT